MSVIIRLQNLPWSANALDIRQFFKGLSIPEGGVHIVGGEMGDAFIAFSTDEDARQAMMFDRKAINGVQIRLLLSSRAEMQKVIETARQQSLLALKKASILSTGKATPPVVTKPTVNATPLPPVISASSFQSIMSNSLAATPSFLAYQQQAGITLTPDRSITAVSTKSFTYDSDDSDSRHSRDKRRSESRERRRSRSRSRERNDSRRRRERSRERSRDKDRQSGRRSTRRSRSRERSRTHNRDHSRDRSRDRSRERSRNSRDTSRRNSGDNIKSRNADVIMKPKQNTSSWNATNAYANYNSMDSSMNAANSQQLNKLSGYQANSNSLDSAPKSNRNANLFNKQPGELGGKNNFTGTVGNIAADTLSSSVAATVSISAVSTTIQNYNTNNASLAALNNYSLSSLLSASTRTDAFKGFALQNPYTTALQTKCEESTGNTTTSTSAIPGIFVEKKSDAIASIQSSQTESVLQQEPIAFSTVNPYEQMYPKLFAQAAALGGSQKSSLATGKKPLLSMPNPSPIEEEFKSSIVDPNDTNTVKISNMCPRTTYSDLRKFFVGLFIPHNGIKMINDKHGLRVGRAYVQFTRQSSVTKALCRSNNLLRGLPVTIEPVAEDEFDKAEDSFRPPYQRCIESEQENSENSEGNNKSGFSPLNPYKKIISTDPFTVLYIEDIPSLGTEQDIIKMFSSYSLYDILLLASPENRREFVAHVRFSREEDAKSAYEDRAHHQIGYRRLRVRPGTIEDMENAKEKIRLANEQLMKEEQDAKDAAEEEETKRKLEELITKQISREEEKDHPEQNIISMDLTQDPDDDENDVIETTNEMKSDNDIYDYDYDADDYGDSNDIQQFPSNNSYSYSGKNSYNNFNNDGRRSGPNNIPRFFDLDPINSRSDGRSASFNDPRLRNGVNNNNITTMGANNFNNFNPNFNSQQPSPAIVNSIEENFVMLKNCEYNTRINDVAQLLLTANLGLKHIEPLRTDRQLPSGEFIVEFRRTRDAEIAVQKFHNVQFRNRSLRVFPILPQEIADRLGKPFLSYIPGGPGPRLNEISTRGGGNDNMGGRNNFNKTNDLMNNNMNNSRFGMNTSQQRGNFNSFRAVNDNSPIMSNKMRGVGGGTGNSNPNISDDISDNMNNNNKNMNSYNNGMPEKFSRPGCVLSLENVPYKAALSDILSFFQGFELTDNDIIRRFNDDGSPTGDARVAFVSPDVARDAYESKKRKQIFGRTIFLNII